MRLAIGSTPRDLIVRVVRALIVAIGIVAGVAASYAFAGVAGRFVEHVRLPGALPLVGAAAVLLGAGMLASLVPAVRASYVNASQALRSD